MVKYFKNHPERHFRALQLWQVLVSMAINRQVTTYEGLAKILGYSGARPVKDVLAYIAAG
jgi:alkylated DNA nucleotide flippase Atl1